MTLKEANEHRNEWFEGVHTCKRDDTLFAVMENIVKAEVHRLVIIDEKGKVCGVVSLSDILSFWSYDHQVRYYFWNIYKGYIKDVILKHNMPPWHSVKKVGKSAHFFVGLHNCKAFVSCKH